jgi:transposase
MLGAEYAGVLQRDGWAPYRQFVHAAHQTCLAHLLRRCRTMMLDHPYHPFAPQVQALLQAVLATRDRHRLGHVSDQGLAVARGQYVNRLSDLLDRRPSRLADARRFATHLRTEFEAVFSFLFDPTLDATNWRAEHALRPAVITRKTCGGGNRTTRGAETHRPRRLPAASPLTPRQARARWHRSATPIAPTRDGIAPTIVRPVAPTR